MLQHQPRVAFVTYAGRPEVTASDQRLVEPLREVGVEAVAVPWDAGAADWKAFDLVVLRSCWDYHRRPAEFRSWVERRALEQAPLWNPAATVLWNMDKLYLLDLQARGLSVVPTVWLDQGKPAVLAQILKEHAWTRAVVKPRIGASAFRTWQTSLDESTAHQDCFRRQLAGAGVMVQKLVPEIAAGEWSLVFFCGAYSHATIKRPGPGQIFVQEELGGVEAIATPPEYLVAQAAHVLDVARHIARPPGDVFLYARVDGIDLEGCLVLMELELIEPALFLDVAPPHASERFVQGIQERIVR